MDQVTISLRGSRPEGENRGQPGVIRNRVREILHSICTFWFDLILSLIGDITGYGIQFVPLSGHSVLAAAPTAVTTLESI